MSDTDSIVFNTTDFNILIDGLNETLIIDEINITLNVKFENIKTPSLLKTILNKNDPTPLNPGDSIQTAINNTNSGDTTLLNGGTYNQWNINVTKSNLTIKTSGNGTPIINADGNGRAFNVNVGGVTIQDLTITNANTTGNGGGIYISGSNSSVTGCNFINTISRGY